MLQNHNKSTYTSDLEANKEANDVEKMSKLSDMQFTAAQTVSREKMKHEVKLYGLIFQLSVADWEKDKRKNLLFLCCVCHLSLISLIAKLQ